MCVCVRVCPVRDTSSTCCTRARTRVWLTSCSARTRAPTLTVTFNVDDRFHLEMIVNIHVIILERVLADSIYNRRDPGKVVRTYFHDEIVQEIKEQLGPSYNRLSL